jgi:hypothetical protein
MRVTTKFPFQLHTRVLLVRNKLFVVLNAEGGSFRNPMDFSITRCHQNPRLVPIELSDRFTSIQWEEDQLKHWIEDLSKSSLLTEHLNELIDSIFDQDTTVIRLEF